MVYLLSPIVEKRFLCINFFVVFSVRLSGRRLKKNAAAECAITLISMDETESEYLQQQKKRGIWNFPVFEVSQPPVL
jgi:hypothetical protein